MAVPHIDFTIKKESFLEDAKTLLLKFRPKWKLNDTDIQIFPGVINNKLLGFFNKDEPDDVVLIRVYSDKSDYIVDRKTEIKNIRYLHLDGLASELYGTFNNGLVYEYIPGEVLTTETCLNEEISEKVARRMADYHTLKPTHIVKEPFLWAFLIKLMALIPLKFSNKNTEKRFQKLFPNRPKLEKEYVFLEKELCNVKSPLVLCHNDLLLGNVIYNEKASTVHFIDFEYLAYNYQAFDIANHFNEYAGLDDFDESRYPDEEYQKKWLKIYLEQLYRRTGCCTRIQVRDMELNALYSVVQKFAMASHLVWAAWSLAQAEYGPKDEFDYLSHAHSRLQAYYNRKKELYP